MNADYAEVDQYSGQQGPPPPPPPPSHPDRPGYGHLPHGGGPPPSYMGRVTAGIIILLIGSIIMASTGFINDPYEEDYDDEDRDEYRDDVESYQDGVRTMNALGQIIQIIGLMILALGLATGALTDDRLGPAVRAGMLIAMGIIVGMKMGATTLYYWF